MAYQFKNISVLVVDSQPAIVDLIHGVLNLFGIRNIITRTDGIKGLQAFDEYEPDLLIVDWDLESMDGLELTRRIRANRKNPFTPVIFMTAFSSQKRVSEARDSGITEFLRKPFTAEALYKRIEEIIERPRPFVRAPEFFGPDRRRKRADGYTGAEKRRERPVAARGSDRRSHDPEDRRSKNPDDRRRSKDKDKK